MLALLLFLPSFYPPGGNDFVSQLDSPIIQCFMFVCLNSVLIYFSENLCALNVLHPVYLGMYTRLHILSDQKARDLRVGHLLEN